MILVLWWRCSLARVGWLLGRLLAGIVMLGWLLMIIGILMVFVIGGLIVLLRWLILLGAQRTSLNHYQTQNQNVLPSQTLTPGTAPHE
jgi:high-affinity Fe2+/Pb2+ permease